jgi:hypothetical protein
MPKKKLFLPKRRISSDYNCPVGINLHPDAVDARNRLTAKFQGQYKKYELDTLAYIVLETVIEFAGINKGEEIESALNLLNKK